MKIPKEIRIAGIDYKVEYYEHLNNGNNILLGEIDLVSCKIALNTKIDNTPHAMQTLWHEILHGIAYHYNITLPKNMEENIINTFATGITQVLQDNARELYDIKKEGTKEGTKK